MKSLSILLILSLLPPYKATAQKINIESLQSLYIEIYHDNEKLGVATAFVIRPKEKYYLVTNYHVLSAKDAQTNALLPGINKSPNRILIMHNGLKIGTHVPIWQNLLIENRDQLWKEVLVGDIARADVAILPITDTFGITLYPVNYKKTTDNVISLRPTERVFVVGFPLGYRYADLPIWKSGLIASEPYLNLNGLPIMHIDMMGFGGMSGSPTYLITNDYAEVNGDKNISVDTETFFMGVFSSGYENISIGSLWKATFLKTVFDQLP